MNVDQKKITEAVIRATVDQLVANFEDESKVYSAVERQAVDLIEKKVDAQINSIFKNGIEKLMFAQTNQYGEKKKDPVSFREFIDLAIKKYLYEMVDYQGKPKSGGYSSDSDKIRLAYLVREQTEETVKKIVTDACLLIKNEIGTIMATTVKAEIDKKMEILKNQRN